MSSFATTAVAAAALSSDSGAAICRNFCTVKEAVIMKNTSRVWMSRYSESKPISAGVRIRLPVTVWKITVETPTATETRTIATA